MTYLQFDASYNILIPFDSTISKKSRVAVIRTANPLFDGTLPTNVDNVVDKTLDEIDRKKNAKDSRSMLLMVSNDDFFMSNFTLLRERLNRSRVDLTMVLMRQSLLDIYNAQTGNSSAPLHCLFQAGEDSTASPTGPNVFSFTNYSIINTTEVVEKVAKRICNGHGP